VISDCDPVRGRRKHRNHGADRSHPKFVRSRLGRLIGSWVLCFRRPLAGVTIGYYPTSALSLPAVRSCQTRGVTGRVPPCQLAGLLRLQQRRRDARCLPDGHARHVPFHQDRPRPARGASATFAFPTVNRVSYGAFVWARRVLNRQKWRLPARAGSTGTRCGTSSAPSAGRRSSRRSSRGRCRRAVEIGRIVVSEIEAPNMFVNLV
jgi:hypothetical protein